MATHDAKSDVTSGRKPSTLSLPDVPADQPLLHDAIAFREKMDDILSQLGLLGIAGGADSLRIAALIDYPIDELPPLVPTAHDYAARAESRLKMMVTNAENETKRYNATMSERTELHSLIVRACDLNAPDLARKIREQCDLSRQGVSGNWFDGPRAYAMLLLHLNGEVGRTRADKEFYDNALKLQTESHLPDGCSATDYATKAYAAIVYIFPNLSRPFSTWDAAEYIVDLMPRELLRINRRGLLRDFKADGTYNDLLTVLRECKLVVKDAQKEAGPPKPAFSAPSWLLTTHLNTSDVQAMALVTGMDYISPVLLAEAAGGGDGGGKDLGGPGGDKKKYCPKCPHPRGKCWRSPQYTGTLPPSVWLNEEARKQIISDKAKNARDEGVPNGRITAPPKSKLDEWKKRASTRAPGAGRGGGAPAGVAAAFFDNLMDIDDPRFGTDAQMVAMPTAVPTTPSAATNQEGDQEDHDDDDASYLWYVAVQPQLFSATVFCTSVEHVDDDTVAAMESLPECGAGANIVSFTHDKALAHEYARELNSEFCPPAPALTATAPAAAVHAGGLACCGCASDESCDDCDDHRIAGLDAVAARHPPRPELSGCTTPGAPLRTATRASRAPPSPSAYDPVGSGALRRCGPIVPRTPAVPEAPTTAHAPTPLPRDGTEARDQVRRLREAMVAALPAPPRLMTAPPPPQTLQASQEQGEELRQLRLQMEEQQGMLRRLLDLSPQGGGGAGSTARPPGRSQPAPSHYHAVAEPQQKPLSPPPASTAGTAPASTNTSVTEPVRYADFSCSMDVGGREVELGDRPVGTIPYELCNAAGQLGARYDRGRARWWLPAGLDHGVFLSALRLGPAPDESRRAGSRDGHSHGSVAPRVSSLAAPPTPLPAQATAQVSLRRCPTQGGGHTRNQSRQTPAAPQTRPGQASLQTAPQTHRTRLTAGAILAATLLGTLVGCLVYWQSRSPDLAALTGAGSSLLGAHVLRDGMRAAYQVTARVVAFVGEHYALLVLSLLLAFGAWRCRAEGAAPTGVPLSEVVIERGWAPPMSASSSVALRPIGSVGPQWPTALNLDEHGPLPPPPHGLAPSPPPSPPPSELQPPRSDLLTCRQAESLYIELLAGNEQPEHLPASLRALVIADTGAATSMPNHEDQCEVGSVYKCDSRIQGAGGALTIKEKANMRMPMETSRGIGAFREKDAILNRTCAYVLLALGRASKEQGVRMVMPEWGGDGYFVYPNGIRVTLLNRNVLLVRPIGYKPSPERSMATANASASAVTLEALGIPVDGDFGMYLGANHPRPGDLEAQLTGSIRLVCIDTCRGGVLHDLTSPSVTEALVDAASLARCRFAYSSVECRTWSSALFLPDAKGQPGRPYRAWPDHVLGFEGHDGKLPPNVEEANAMARCAAAVCRAVAAHGGFFLAETPACRRTGQPDETTGCEQHASMLDHPAWVSLAQETEAHVELTDQCMWLDDPATAVETGPKATAVMVSGNISNHTHAELGARRCRHSRGTHRALRGTVNDQGTYATVGTERYSARFCAAIARIIRRALADGPAIQLAEVSALVAGVLHGKRTPQNSVDARFFHDICNHSEQRVVELMEHALCDVEPWVTEVVKKAPCGPCEACLKAEAPKIGPTGQLPQDETLLFIDIWHCNVPAIITGNRTRIAAKHAGKSKYLKSTGISRKSDAPEGVSLILAFFNSNGTTCKWIHSDCAPELKSGGVGEMAKERLIRVTTNVPNTSRANGVEPMFRVGRKVVATLLERSRLPLCFHEPAWCYFEEGHALKPSREPPHDCSLGRLLGTKPPGLFRRPFGCLCYVTDAPRLPNGTLVNKFKAQARRCIHLGYSGGRSGAYEQIGVNRSKPGYICYDPETNEMLVTESVRFIPACFPGLQRTAGGGWRIPAERIPFSAESLQAEAVQPAGPPPLAADSSRTVDLDQAASEEALTDFDYDRLTYAKGFAPEDEEQKPPSTPQTAPQTQKTISRLPAQPKSPPPHVLVPREIWPDYRCDEHHGKGWEAEVTATSRDGKYARCKFVNETNSEGRRFYSEWIEQSRLLPLGETEAPPPTQPLLPSPMPPASPLEQSTAQPTPTPRPDPYLVPNENTVPHEPGADPLQEPTRPQRQRLPVDRFSPATLAAQYVAAAGVGYDANATTVPLPDTLYVELDSMGERFVALAMAGIADEESGAALAQAAREQYEGLPVELQRAACIMADHAILAEELGMESPQAILARETYAAAMVDAATHGYRAPALDPLYTVLPPPRCAATHGSPVGGGDDTLHEASAIAAAAVSEVVETAAARAGAPSPASSACAWASSSCGREVTTAAAEQLPLSTIFNDEHDGCLFVVPIVNVFDELALVAKKRSSPDIYSEREMCGPEWDEPKQVEVATLEKMGAFTRAAADDPRVKGLTIVNTMFTGRDKRDADRNVVQKKGRCVLRGDEHKCHYNVTGNQSTAPVVRCTSASCADAVAAIRCRHSRSGDVPAAYLQGVQRDSEQVVARPPKGFQETDERGVEILWIMHNPLYGQVDAGQIWNRTLNGFMTSGGSGDPVSSVTHAADVTAMYSSPVNAVTAAPSTSPVDEKSSIAGMGMRRCTYDPCVYSRATDDGHVSFLVYVDDIRGYWDADKSSCAAGEQACDKLSKRFNIKFGEVDPAEDFFLGANRSTSAARDRVTTRATSYIDGMVERYCDGDVSPCKRFPATWSFTPADEELERAHEAAMVTRTPAPPSLFKEYNSLVGSLRHAVKFRPEISAAMDLLGCCLTFPTDVLLTCAYRVLVYLGRTRKLGITYSKHAPRATELWALADSNWRHIRSTSGFCIFLGAGAVSTGCRRQGCIAMSSTEAELVALAECAIELIVTKGVLDSHGYVIDGPISVGTDNKGAYDLCHRYTSAQHSRHIDRKLYKMREMRGKGLVNVRYVPTDDNTADIFTKVLKRQPFEKHRRTVLNLAASD